MTMLPVFIPALAVIALLLWPRSGRWGVNFAKVNCPKCGQRMPSVRHPTSMRQALWGGWTCRNCACEIDKYGKEIAPPSNVA
jgi:hypothetical protein